MADYHKIIAARQRVQSLFVPHLAVGGVLGAVGGGLSTAWKEGGSAIGGMNPVTNAKNNFHADAPEVPQHDFRPGMSQGTDLVTSGTNTMAGAAGRLGQVGDATQGISSNQMGIGNKIQQLGQGVTGAGGVLSQQQGLANDLSAQAHGQGPNPAQEQFKQNINQAIAQNAGMISSQKGINPALAARMGAQSGAAMEQGAAGNAATLQAQQQLGAQQLLGGQQQAMGNTIQGAGNLLQGAGNAYGQAGNTLGQAGNAYGAAGSLGGGIAGAGNTMLGTSVQGNQGQNALGVQSSLGAQGINAGVAASNTKMQGDVMGGILNAGGGAAAAAMAHGGTVGVDGKALNLAQALMAQGGAVPGQPKSPGKDEPSNDTVPTVLSPKEIVLPLSVAEAPDAPQKAAEFVEQLKTKAHPTYGHVLKARKALEAAEAAHKAQGGMC